MGTVYKWLFMYLWKQRSNGVSGIRRIVREGVTSKMISCAFLGSRVESKSFFSNF